MGVGVNTTDPLAATVHGTNPQNLVEKITRLKVYASLFWKEHCFGLTAETLVDRAMGLQYYGGTYGGLSKPTKFLCLILKMLQLQPEKDIIIEFIKNPDFKYVRVLGAFYLRLVGKPVDIYKYLELLYNDYRKIRHRAKNGWETVRVDEFIDELLTNDYACDIALPRLPKRWHLEEAGMLEPRVSLAEVELDDEDEEDGKAEADEDDAAQGHLASNSALPAQEEPGEPRELGRTEEPQVQGASRDERGGGRRSRERQASNLDEKRDRGRDPSAERARRSRSHDRQTSHRRDRSRSRDRRKDRSRSRDRPRDRSRDRERRRDRSRSRGRRERSPQRRSRSPPADRDRIRSRSHSRDRRDRSLSPKRSASKERKKKSKKKSKKKASRKDALFKKVEVDETEGLAPEASAVAAGASKDASSLSVEETNKLRLSLGLKPLK